MRKFKTNFIALSLFCGSFFMHPGSAEAFIASVKGAGMGMTGVAFPQDALVGAYNPGAISAVCSRFDLGVSWIRTEGTTTLKDNQILRGRLNAQVGCRDIFTPDFGVIYQVDPCYSIPCYPTTVGLVVYNKHYCETCYNRPVIVGSTKVESCFLQEIISPMIAVKLGECNTIGASLDIVGQVLELKGFEGLAAASLFPNEVTNKGKEWVWGIGTTIGWYGHILDCLDLGFVWKPKVKMGRFKKYQGFLAEKGQLDAPEEFRGGASIELLPCLYLASDVRYVRYDKIRALSNSSHSAALAGSAEGPGFGWKSQTSVHIGTTYYPYNDLAIRAGWRYAKTPYERDQTFANFIVFNSIQHYLTLGATWKFSNCQELSLFWAHGFDKNYRGKKDSIPANALGGVADLNEEKNAFGGSFGMYF